MIINYKLTCRIAGVSPLPIKYRGFPHTVVFTAYKSPSLINFLKHIRS